MKHAPVVFALLLVCSLTPAQSAEWRLGTFLDGKRSATETLQIVRENGRATVKDFQGERLRSESVLDAFGTPLELRRYGDNGEVVLEATVTGGRRIIVRSAGTEKTLSSAEDVVLSDSGMYWAFSVWLSRDPSFPERTFSIYQDDSGRLQRMKLRNAGIEIIQAGGRTYKAYRLEMSIPDPLARIFWPYSYNYWYSAEDFRFLAYEGPLADRRISRTEAE
jgi:hypothetical protein